MFSNHPRILQLKSAFIILTRLPFITLEDEDFDLKNALWAFPLVGMGLAGLLFTVMFICHTLGLPALVGAMIVTLASILLTGALHEDGLADCVDALGGKDVEQRLNIMRDSQIGTYGSLALIFSILIRSSAVYLLWDSGYLVIAILLSLMISRGAMVLVAYFGHPARADGLAAALQKIDIKQVITGQAVIFILGIIFIQLYIFTLMIFAGLITFLISQYAKRKVGGFTGDVLGATEQLVQISCWLIFLTMA